MHEPEDEKPDPNGCAKKDGAAIIFLQKLSERSKQTLRGFRRGASRDRPERSHDMQRGRLRIECRSTVDAAAGVDTRQVQLVRDRTATIRRNGPAIECARGINVSLMQRLTRPRSDAGLRRRRARRSALVDQSTIPARPAHW